MRRLRGIGLLGNVEKLRCRGLVDQVYALFLQGDEKIVELVGIDFLVGQVFVDFVVGQISLGFALGNQFLQVFVEMVHLVTPFTPLFGRPGCSKGAIRNCYCLTARVRLCGST